MYTHKYKNLFQPLRVRNLILKNRVMSAPNMLFRTIDGRPDAHYVAYLEHKARGGAAIVTLGEANVADGGNHTPGMVMSLENMAIYSEISQAIHEHGAVAAVELTHGGMNARPQFNKDANLVMGPVAGVNPMTGFSARQMTEADMDYVANAFADAAEYWYRAGFDALLVHCAHGWLLTQFLSPIINTRTDEYGGSLENRMRFPLKVLRAIRERAGQNRAVFIRLSGSERRENGFTAEDMAEFLSHAQEYVDLAEISCEDMTWFFANTYVPRGQNAEFAATIKRSGKVHIPVFTIGSILEPQQAEEILASGGADGVSMSRALIADPFWVKKAAENRAEDINPCLRCLTCTDSDNQSRHFICAVNPLTAREARLGFGDTMPLAKVRKRVLVVGGGPAGMTAAFTAAQRGHDVTLAERSSALGGLLRFTETDNLKLDLRRLHEYLVRQTERSGAEILLNTEVDDAFIEKFAPDHIIVATGSTVITPNIPGIENARHVLSAYYEGARGKNVVVIGGGLAGIETCMYLNHAGYNVTVLEALGDVARDARSGYRAGLMRQLAESGMNIITNARVTSVANGAVAYEKDSATHVAECDDVFFAVGMRRNDAPYFELYGKAPFVTLIGDAKTVGKADGAVHTGYFAALDV